MSVLPLSYSTFGLTTLSVIDAIHAVADAGYEGIELAFHKTHFNPFNITEDLLEKIRCALRERGIKPACISSPTHFFMDERPHEPSLFCTDIAGRKQRIDLIRRAVKVAQAVGAPLVCFGSGFVREEHVKRPDINPRQLLAESIRECLIGIKDVTLVIEPEPGMLIETMDQGMELIREIDHPNFRLHLDLNHVVCGDENYLEKIKEAAPLTRYLHISDTVDGYNIKMILDSELERIDFSQANYLIYFPKTADFMVVDRQNAWYFYDCPLSTDESRRINNFAKAINNSSAVRFINYNDLNRGTSPYDAEIDVYGFSVQRMSFYVVDRAKPILRYLREQGIATSMVANTVTGKVHYHEIPGKGDIDLAGCFRVLLEEGYQGFGSVELYHHVDCWKAALTQSRSYLESVLSSCLDVV